MDLVRRFVAGYRDAFADFTPNAKRLLAGHALQNVAMGILLIVFGLFVKAKTGSDAVLGGSEAAQSAALAVICLVSAPLVTMVGYRNTLLLGASAYAVARFGQAALPFTGALLAFGFVGGIGEGSTRPQSRRFCRRTATSDIATIYTASTCSLAWAARSLAV